MRVMIVGDFECHLSELERACTEAWQLRLRLVLPDSVGQADFLWLVAPDGMVDVATSLLVGWAIGLRIPRFSTARIADETLRTYVIRVDDMVSAVGRIDAAVLVDRHHAQAARRLLALERPFASRLTGSR